MVHHASIDTRYGHQIKALVIRFLPVFNKEERKRFAEIAIGEALPDENYKSLHENVLVFSDIQAEQQMSIHMDINEEDDFENAKIKKNVTRSVEREQAKDKALYALEEAFMTLKIKIEGGDSGLLDGV